MSNMRRLIAGVLQVSCIGVALVGMACLRCGSELKTDIGNFESKEAGMRSSIRKLATEIRRCPGARLYRVIWHGPYEGGDQSMREQAILYDREHKRLGYEQDIYSGIAGKAYIVDAEAIDKVAQSGGSLDAWKLRLAV